MTAALRQFRKKHSLRIAYRSINTCCSLNTTLEELSELATFCLITVYKHLYKKHEDTFGTPWDEARNTPAPFCILGMGKLGGYELNFCSDIDLIYLYDGNGSCRKDGRQGAIENREFFNRLARELTAIMQAKTEDGMLYNMDLRLRPEGDGSPLARSMQAAVHYYWSSGQVWERLALAKARVVCGDVATGEAFLEDINPFRYPRYPPHNIFEEIAGVKLRMERDVLDEKQRLNDIKNGVGGIREIEFICQGLQAVHGGHNPFLQTSSTLDALKKLLRYEHLSQEETDTLTHAWERLRHVENHLQIREDARTHSLPQDPSTRKALAASFGQKNVEAFFEELDQLRHKVRTLYEKYLPHGDHEIEIQDWSLFLSGREPTPSIQQRIQTWFPHAENAEDRLRQFVLGKHALNLPRDHTVLFLEIAEALDSLLPRLARPMQTLERISTFSSSYRARKAFFKACADNPILLRILCLLFDCSVFIFELLNRRPEMMEELLHEAPLREKSLEDTLAEMARLPQDERFANYLWLYVRAEQVRIAIAQLLHNAPTSDTERALTRLADATLQCVLKRIDPAGRLCVIALGKYGGTELSFGSDLDILFLGDPTHTRLATRALQIVNSQPGRDNIFDIDLRLRPYGNDGPIVSSLEAFEHYHKEAAQFWERQILTRARYVCGNPPIGDAFLNIRERLLYTQPARSEDLQQIWNMRQRIMDEKCDPKRPFMDIKACPGGLLDIEFLAQTLQLAQGKDRPELRTPSTRTVLQNACGKASEGSSIIASLLTHYEYLRRIELYLRRYDYSQQSSLPEDSDGIRALALWLGEEGSFLERHVTEMKKCRKEVTEFLEVHLEISIE